VNYHPYVKAVLRSLATSVSTLMERDIPLWRGSEKTEEEIGLDLSRMEHVTTTVNHTPEEPTGQPTLSTLEKTSTGEATVEMEPEQTFNKPSTKERITSHT